MREPSFFDATRVGDVYTERATIVAAAAEEARRRGGPKPAVSDAKRVVAFGIDCQVGFCSPGASLFVPGAVEDTTRTIQFLYANLEKITELVFSLDTHSVHQIFHPAFWRSPDGAPPSPFTTISHADVQSGAWRPASRAAEHAQLARDYTKKLETNGKYRLTIWPYHTLLGRRVACARPGSDGGFDLPRARARDEHRVRDEGHAPADGELLGVRAGGDGGRRRARWRVQRSAVRSAPLVRRDWAFGQAKSHCVLSTLEDLVAHMKTKDPALVRRVKVLVDATSPVPAPPLDPLPPELDFAAVANRAFEALAAEGVQMKKSTDAV